MKRPQIAAAVFALAAGAIWIAEVLWLRRVRDADQEPQPDDTTFRTNGRG